MAINHLLDLAEELKDKKEDKTYIVEEMQKVILNYSPMGDDVNRSSTKLGKPSNHYTPSRLFSIEELPVALFYIALNDGAFDESILDGINSGRDTDSIGVMIGAILGAMKGSNIVTKEVVEDLEVVNQYKLQQICETFTKTAETIIMKDIHAEKIWIDRMNRLIGEQ
jgi:ADP-ribosylglycohydrolase